jgi:hypothetical protein
MTILADTFTAISSYNEDIVVESSPVTTALEQYWAERRRICEEAVGRLQQPFSENDAERVWINFCSSKRDFSSGFSSGAWRSWRKPLRQLWGWNFGLIREAKTAFLQSG